MSEATICQQSGNLPEIDQPEATKFVTAHQMQREVRVCSVVLMVPTPHFDGTASCQVGTVSSKQRKESANWKLRRSLSIWLTRFFDDRGIDLDGTVSLILCDEF
ncbi:hypothetical protein [Roseovarius pacificus]|uniref:hypothetical protein n=1 Tax=Roseovarius pacificus TaxID=337701 RepID=UPI0037486F51